MYTQEEQLFEDIFPLTINKKNSRSNSRISRALSTIVGKGNSAARRLRYQFSISVALFGKQAREVINLAHEKKVLLLISNDILAELEAVLKKKFKYPPLEIRLVSGNKKHLQSLGTYKGMPILTAKQFLNLVK